MPDHIFRTPGEPFTPPASLRIARVPSPMGDLAIATCSDALCGASFNGDTASLAAALRSQFTSSSVEEGPIAPAIRDAFAAYFSGELNALDEIAVIATGSTFECAVWRALLDIPVGETRSYGEIAKAVGDPGAARAVGVANARNPVPLVVPCHRVIGADGSLVGFGGGMERKVWLLRHERARAVAQGELF